MWKTIKTLSAVALLLTSFSLSAALPADPLESPQWETMYKLFMKEGPVVFDDRVKILAPDSAEDSMAVPVMVDADAIDDVREVVVVADLNPLPKVLDFTPSGAAVRLGFKVKIQQSTPIRAAVRTGDGVWHVGGVWLEAAGGGCTAPSLGSGLADWSERLGEVSARLWPREDGSQRLRFAVMHPMDTGLAPGIPVFHIEDIVLSDAEGRELMRIRPAEPVSENPLFSVDLPKPGAVRISGRDNNGNSFDGQVTP